MKSVLKKLLLVSTMLLLTFTVALPLLNQKVQAITDGTCTDRRANFSGQPMCQTFFYDQPTADDNGWKYGWAWPIGSPYGNGQHGYVPPIQCGGTCNASQSQTNAANFIDFMRRNLQLCGSPYTANGSDSSCPASSAQCPAGGIAPYYIPGRTCNLMVVAANAMIIDTMLGQRSRHFRDGTICPIGSNPLQCGISYAQNHFNGANNWADLVNQYAQLNLINWYQRIALSSLPSNCTVGNDGTHDPGPGVTDTLPTAGYLQVDTIAYCNRPPNEIYITFKNPDGSVVRINARCGNLTGALGPLNPPPRTNTFTINTVPTVDIGDNESPSPANFTVTSSSNRAPVKNVHIITNFYIIRYGGGRSALSPGGDNTVTNFPSTGAIVNLHRPPVGLPSLNAGDKVCMSAYASPGTGQVDSNGNIVSGSDTAPAEVCVTIKNKPYVRTFGADTFAGTSAGCVFAGWPASNSSGGIYGYSSGANNAGKGAGAQLALLSLYNIIGFRSGVLQTVPALTSTAVGNPLHFANTPTGSFSLPAGYTSQGGLLNTSHCPSNYVGAASTQTVSSPTPPATLSAGTTGSFKHSGPTYVLNGGTGLAGRSLIYVTGNVVINNNITYQTSGWTGPDTTPSLTIVATGNIYISSNVTQLDGVFIAQNSAAPSSANGTIYTCSTNTTPATNANAFGLCNKQLTVNGALIADRLKLLRTYGSLRNSGTSDDSPYGGAKACTNNGSGAVSAGSCAAEVINFRPEIYLTNPVLGNSGSNSPHIDYIVSPSPLL